MLLKKNNIYIKLENSLYTFDLWEFFGADPFKGWFPPSFFCHMNFLDQLQAPQHISYIIQPAYFRCKHIERQQG